MKSIITKTLIVLMLLTSSVAHADIITRTEIKFYKRIGGNDILIESETKRMNTKVEIDWTDAVVAGYQLYESVKTAIASFSSGNIIGGGVATYASIQKTEELIDKLTDKHGQSKLKLYIDASKWSKVEVIYHVEAGDALRYSEVIRPQNNVKFEFDKGDYKNDNDGDYENDPKTYDMRVTIKTNQIFSAERYIVAFASAETDCNTCGFVGDIIDFEFYNSNVTALTPSALPVFVDLNARYNRLLLELKQAETDFQTTANNLTRNNQESFLDGFRDCDPGNIYFRIMRASSIMAGASPPSNTCVSQLYNRYAGISPNYFFGIPNQNALNQIKQKEYLVKTQKINLRMLERSIHRLFNGLTESLTARLDINYYFSRPGAEPDLITTESLEYYPSLGHDQQERGILMQAKAINLNLDASGNYIKNGRSCNFIYVTAFINSTRERNPDRSYYINSFLEPGIINVSNGNFIQGTANDRNGRPFYRTDGVLNTSFGFNTTDRLPSTFKYTFGVISNIVAGSSFTQSSVIYNPPSIPASIRQEWNCAFQVVFEISKPAPAITRFYPSIASPGNIVTVRGQNFEDFVNRDPNASVSIANVPVKVTSATATELKFLVQSNTPNGSIKVTTRSGSNFSSSIFRRNIQIHDIYPKSGKVGDQIEIRGTGFTKYNIRRITVGTIELNSHDFTIYDSLIKFRVNEQIQTGPVAIETNQSRSTSGEVFGGMTVTSSNVFTKLSNIIPPKGNTSSGSIPSTNLNAPIITGFSPRQANIYNTITINGSGFTGVNALKFDDQAVNFKIINDNTITLEVTQQVKSGYLQIFKSPNWIPFTAYPFTNLQMSTPTPPRNNNPNEIKQGVDDNKTITDPNNGKQIIIATPFIKKAPVIHSFTPESGAAGTEITIKGENFDNQAQVYIGTQHVKPYMITATSLKIKTDVNTPNGVIKINTSVGSTTSAKEFKKTVTQSFNILKPSTNNKN